MLAEVTRGRGRGMRESQRRLTYVKLFTASSTHSNTQSELMKWKDPLAQITVHGSNKQTKDQQREGVTISDKPVLTSVTNPEEANI